MHFVSMAKIITEYEPIHCKALMNLTHTIMIAVSFFYICIMLTATNIMKYVIHTYVLRLRDLNHCVQQFCTIPPMILTCKCQIFSLFATLICENSYIAPYKTKYAASYSLSCSILYIIPQPKYKFLRKSI